MRALKSAGEGDVLLLHACCHNPTGIDPTPEQWKEIAKLVQAKQLLPFFDFAYQGLGESIEADAQGLRGFVSDDCEMIVSSSFSKNFGLYNERTGALTLVTKSKDSAEKTLTHLRKTIRVNYSNPPAHGASVVTTVLKDAALRAEWESELKEMCARIQRMRESFVATLKKKGVAQDFSFIAKQRGMFSYSGLTKQHVDQLREKFSIYVVGSGRINVAGMTQSNMDTLCEGIAAVLKG